MMTEPTARSDRKEIKMETVYEMKIDVTFVEKDSVTGSLPFGLTDRLALAAKLKERLGADDLHITGVKVFEIGEG